MLHGFRDNAGTFDKLIPLLPQTFYYISIDLPGHGKSSPIPTPTFVTFLDFVYTLKYTLDYFNRKKYILMGHSFGGATCLMFTQTFPEYVLKLICLDAIHYLPVSAQECIPRLRRIITQYEKSSNLDSKNAPSYKLEEVVEKMKEQRFSEISDEGSQILLQRALIPQSDGRYKISTAQQLKYVLEAPMSFLYHEQLLKYYPVTCPHLNIGASNSAHWRQAAKGSLDQMRKNKYAEEFIVQGSHDVHVDHPDRVAPIITAFLLKHTSKL